MSVTQLPTETPPPAEAASSAPPATSGWGVWDVLNRLSAGQKGLLALVAVALGALYAPTFQRLARIWSVNPDYSHGFLVIPASLFFAGIAWNRNQQQLLQAQGPTTGDLLTGIIEVALGLLLHLAGLLIDLSILDVVSLICVLRGTILIVAGSTWNRAFAFPALFLIFLAPLPPAVHSGLALFMQQAVAWASTMVLDLFGVPIYREGYMMHIPGYTMEVGAACSGLRSMTAILALAVAIGFLMNGSRFYCWTLTLLALPIAALANCVRVVLTGVIMITLGREYADGVYHQLEGMLLEAIAAGLLVAVAYSLARFDRRATTTASLAPTAGATT